MRSAALEWKQLMIQSIEGVRGVIEKDQETQPLNGIISCYKGLKEMRETQPVNGTSS